jgi:hypothetical protein
MPPEYVEKSNPKLYLSLLDYASFRRARRDQSVQAWKCTGAGARGVEAIRQLPNGPREAGRAQARHSKLFFARLQKGNRRGGLPVGEDGSGKGGVVGYFSWVAECHPRSYAKMLVSVLSMELADPDSSEEPLAPSEENDQRIREYIGLKGRNRTNTVQPKSQSRKTWTGQPFPVGGLMQLAVEHPKEFCTLLGAAFFRPPAKRVGLKRERRERLEFDAEG